ncbi:MAG: hypothetical protein M3Y54_19775 [Bacteroidota bacterium]|nr:hypothetical protein [Bacteroidota bacterium]
MKLLLLLSTLLLGGSITACNGQPASAPLSKTARPVGPARAAAPAGPHYEVRGLLDPGINNMVAFAFKIPRGWQLHQSFTRAWNGAVPSNVIYISLNSPDKHSAIEYLPEAGYHYVDGPQARSLNQMAAQYGGTRDPGRLAPMPPVAYLKAVLLPRLARTAGGQIRLTGEHAGAVENLGQGQQRATGYIDGVLPSGRPVRLAALLTSLTSNLNGEVYCNWTANTSVTQSDINLAATYAYNLAIQKSVVLNPVWQQQIQQLTNNGVQSNNTEAQKRYAIQKDLQDYQRKTYSEIAANRRASQDRQSEAFGDYIRGEAKYEDAATGQRVKVADGYSHVYSDRQGTTLSTNVPLDAGQVNWQELQRVETKNY